MMLLDQALNHAADLYFGAKTGGVVETKRDPHDCHASTLSYRGIRTLMQFLDMNEDDVMIDIGCGKGRPLLVAARCTKVGAVVGIEIDPDMTALCRFNTRSIANKAVVMCRDAVTFDYKGTTCAWMFNPVGPHTLEKVLLRIRETARPRFRMVYVNPDAAQKAVIANAGYIPYGWQTVHGMEAVYVTAP